MLCHFAPPGSLCQELHKRAWDLVGTYLSANLRLFSGLAKDAESVTLPLVGSYIQESFSEIPECRSFEDHAVVCWINLPSSGVVTVHRYDWVLTAVTNIMAQFRRNGLAVILHPNRGQVAERNRMVKYVIVF